MPRFARTRRGFTLAELIAAVLIVSLLAILALPRTGKMLDSMRARSALDRVVAEIYRARMHAVEVGLSTRLVLQTDSDGCIRRVRVEADDDPVQQASTSTHLSTRICLRHSGDSILTFNSRGLLRPPARSLHAAYRGSADSVLISIAGRVRRTYRRRRSGRASGSGRSWR